MKAIVCSRRFNTKTLGTSHLDKDEIENTTTDKESLIISIIWTVVFFLVIRFINKRVTGTRNAR